MLKDLSCINKMTDNIDTVWLSTSEEEMFWLGLGFVMIWSCLLSIQIFLYAFCDYSLWVYTKKYAPIVNISFWYQRLRQSLTSLCKLENYTLYLKISSLYSQLNSFILKLNTPQNRYSLSRFLVGISALTIIFLSKEEERNISYNIHISILGIILSVLSEVVGNEYAHINCQLEERTLVLVYQIIFFAFALFCIKNFVIGFVMVLIGAMVFILRAAAILCFDEECSTKIKLFLQEKLA